MISEVLEMLKKSGYREALVPLRVAEIDFAFDAVLVGPDDCGNLVVVVSDDGTNSSELVRRIRSLLLVLTRTNSSRPLAVVLVGEPDSPTGAHLKSFARVVSIGASASGEAVRKALGGLLRLRVPQPIEPISTGKVFSDALGPLGSDPVCRAFLQAARRGTEDVEDALLRAVAEAVADREGGQDD